MARAVFCTVQTTSKASSIVERLKDAGFMPNDISVLAPNKDSTKEFAIDNETKAPEGRLSELARERCSAVASVGLLELAYWRFLALDRSLQPGQSWPR